jgi:hypothetical protein
MLPSLNYVGHHAGHVECTGTGLCLVSSTFPVHAALPDAREAPGDPCEKNRGCPPPPFTSTGEWEQWGNGRKENADAEANSELYATAFLQNRIFFTENWVTSRVEICPSCPV